MLLLLRAAGLPVTGVSDFRDAEVTQLPYGTTAIATSTDLIFDFGLQPRDFGTVAATHALSDLYAALARPLLLTVTLGLPSRSLQDDSAAEVLAGVLVAADRSGAVLGGGHTVLADRSFVGVSVVGTNVPSHRIALLEGQQYDLLLSKPLGSGVYITAAENDLLDIAHELDLLQSMTTSNAAAAASLHDLVANQPHSLGFITDVSGFGLLIAVKSKLTTGWRAEVDHTLVPYLPRARQLVREQGLATALGEHNAILIAADQSYITDAVSFDEVLILSDPQTSGGLVAAVSKEVSGALLKRHPLWRRIGEVVPAPAKAPDYTLEIS